MKDNYLRCAKKESFIEQWNQSKYVCKKLCQLTKRFNF